MHGLRTWIEIDKKALRHNVGEFFRVIHPETRFMAVIKSNAYGHGLTLVAKLLAESGITFASSPSISGYSPLLRYQREVRRGRDKASLLPPLTPPILGGEKDNSNGNVLLNSRLWFGVDSIVEALRLRREGITNPILVLGFTLPSRMEDAVAEHISISISNFDALNAVAHMHTRPAIHLKLDTGMHRQGFLAKDTSRVINLLKKKKINPEGVFTHFAAAKDPLYPNYTLMQLGDFNKRVKQIHDAGFTHIIRHSAATGGTMLFSETHLDMVRIGIGLYGYWPSEEAKSVKRSTQNKDKEMEVKLKPILTWKTIVGEVKKIPKGSFVGYDVTERVNRPTTIAVLPIGYWHGYDRGFSSQGQVIVRNSRARILGRVSMDMIVIDVTDIPSVRVGDEVVIIGKQGKETIDAQDCGRMIGTSPYELLTRINPLVKRISI